MKISARKTKVFCLYQGRIEVRTGVIAPLKLRKVISFTMTLYNAENSIRDMGLKAIFAIQCFVTAML